MRDVSSHGRRCTAGWRALGPALALLLLAACGSGGEAPPEPPFQLPTQVLDGLSGVVVIPDTTLGRISEQEPNDDRQQPYALAPLWPRCSFELTGECGVSGAHYGRADPTDVLRFTSLFDQTITLDLTYTALDPVGGLANEMGIAVYQPGVFTPVATAPDMAGPRSVTFHAPAEQAFDIVLSIASGHAAYVAHFQAADPPGGPPKPSVPAPAAPSGGASAKPAPSSGATPAPSAAATLVAAGEPACASTHLLVRLRKGCDADAFCSRRGLRRGRRLATGSWCMAFDTQEGGSGRRAAVDLGASLRADPDVEWAEPDWIVHSQSTPNDPSFNRQWNMRMIGAPAAWGVTMGDPSVVVAVIDTGIVPHPDLTGQTVPGYDFITDPAVAFDGDGRDADPTDRGDRFDGAGLSTWHGTHLSAIVAAKANDGYGVTGVAPGCRVMPLRVLGIGGGFVSDAVDAIGYSAGLYTTATGQRLGSPVEVINLSLGLAQDSPDLALACQQAANQGCYVVAAVGNDGASSVLYPAAYPSVRGIGAVGADYLKAPYSNIGPEVAFVAPGGVRNRDRAGDGWMDGILSCVRDELRDGAPMTHQYLVGTSQAVPHVAGAAALLLSMDPTLSAGDIDNILEGSALDLGAPGRDDGYGNGLVQVGRAVTILQKIIGPERADPPKLMLTADSLQIDGFDNFYQLWLANEGGGELPIFSLAAETDDGAPWLKASFDPSGRINPTVSIDRILIEVDRSQVPPGPGRYSGSIRIRDTAKAVGSLRVTMMLSERTRVGTQVEVAALSHPAMALRTATYAAPERGYRYLVRDIDEGFYVLRGGEDQDGDGLTCEGFEACGWHGGPTLPDAVPVIFRPGEPFLGGLRIDLVDQVP